jgi:hypothetical protein
VSHHDILLLDASDPVRKVNLDIWQNRLGGGVAASRDDQPQRPFDPASLG